MNAASQPPHTYALTRRELSQLLGAERARSALQQVATIDNASCGGGQDAVDTARPECLLPPGVVRTVLASLGHDFQPAVLAFINLKGGVGKTTSALSLATRAAQFGYKVCLMDLDSQASATLALDMAPADGEPVFYDIWQNPEKLAPAALRQASDHLWLLPSALENSLLESGLHNPASQKKAVASVCNALQQQGFELIVIDCPPSLGAAVISAICAASAIIVPMGSDAFSFKGLELTLDEVGAICETFGLEQPAMRVLLTRVDRREKLVREALERLQREHPDRLLPVSIRTSTELAHALERRETVFASHRKNPAREDYDMLARELLDLNGLLDHA